MLKSFIEVLTMIFDAAQNVLKGSNGLQGYKDRADNYICAVLPGSMSQSSQTSYTPGAPTITYFEAGSSL